MDKPTRAPAKKAVKPPVDLKAAAPPAAAHDPPKPSAVDIEAFSRNVARLIEEGGKALAAYMKPREQGKIKADAGEDIADAVKTIGQVAEYWLSDPQRALELQASLGRA